MTTHSEKKRIRHIAESTNSTYSQALEIWKSIKDSSISDLNGFKGSFTRNRFLTTQQTNAVGEKRRIVLPHSDFYHLIYEDDSDFNEFIDHLSDWYTFRRTTGSSIVKRMKDDRQSLLDIRKNIEDRFRIVKKYGESLTLRSAYFVFNSDLSKKLTHLPLDITQRLPDGSIVKMSDYISTTYAFFILAEKVDSIQDHPALARQESHLPEGINNNISQIILRKDYTEIFSFNNEGLVRYIDTNTSPNDFSSSLSFTPGKIAQTDKTQTLLIAMADKVIDEEYPEIRRQMDEKSISLKSQAIIESIYEQIAYDCVISVRNQNRHSILSSHLGL